jgi:CheY-like chemotaxis protein
MKSKILFVEDNPHKRTRVTEYIRTISNECVITEAYSFSSGCQAIERDVYDFILLDISLPTYDRVGNESGGKFRPFAGKEIARKLTRAGGKSKIVFITQYNSFSDKGTSHSLDGLVSVLMQDSPSNFAGLVFYDSSRSSWKTEISRIFRDLGLCA